MPSHLCDYVYALSTTFTEFYDNCYVVERDADRKVKKVNHERVLLAKATVLTMAKVFDLVGIRALERI